MHTYYAQQWYCPSNFTEGLGTLKFTATEKMGIFSFTLSYPGNSQEKKVCCDAITFHANFLERTLMGVHEPHAPSYHSIRTHALSPKHCRIFLNSDNVRVIFLRGNILALNNAFCLWYGYCNCWSNLYPAILVCKPRNYHYLTLPIYIGAHLRCFWDNQWRHICKPLQIPKKPPSVAHTWLAAITRSSIQTNLHSCREVVSI